MISIRWLHLTDVHQGMGSQSGDLLQPQWATPHVEVAKCAHEGESTWALGAGRVSLPRFGGHPR
jgi:hypothetical protein